MIVVITTTVFNERTRRLEQIVSHGIDLATDKAVCLPPVSLQEIGAVYNADLCAFVLRD